VSWDRQISGVSPPLPGGFSGIAYGSGKFVTVGGSGPVVSTDGVTWTTTPSLLPGRLTGIAYGKQQFVAVGSLEDIEDVPHPVIVTSSDSVNWTLTKPSNLLYALTAVAFGQDQFVAAGYSYRDGRGAILSSPDGVNWTQQLVPTHPETVPPPRFWGVGYANGQFIAVGDSGTILTSPDGSNWTKRPSRSIEQLYGVAFGNGQIVVSGGDGTLLTSMDGLAWVPRRSGVADLLQALAFGSGQFVAVGWAGSLLSSKDGVNWVRHGSPALQYGLSSVTYGPDGRFVAVGPGSTIVQSDPVITLTEGLNWNTDSLSLSVEAPAGRSYTVESSTDLRNWSTLTNLNGALSLELPRPALGRTFYRAFSQ
jgi:hypothetical protein